MTARIIVSAALLLLGLSCTTTPRITEVTHTETLYKERHASLRGQHGADEQVYVAWTSAIVDTIKLEYRQPSAPEKISEQTAPATSRHWTTFNITTNDFSVNGPISAWRVTLWRNDKQLAEKKSVLW